MVCNPSVLRFSHSRAGTGPSRVNKVRLRTRPVASAHGEPKTPRAPGGAAACQHPSLGSRLGMTPGRAKAFGVFHIPQAGAAHPAVGTGAGPDAQSERVGAPEHQHGAVAGLLPSWGKQRYCLEGS